MRTPRYYDDDDSFPSYYEEDFDIDSINETIKYLANKPEMKTKLIEIFLRQQEKNEDDIITGEMRRRERGMMEDFNRRMFENIHSKVSARIIPPDDLSRIQGTVNYPAPGQHLNSLGGEIPDPNRSYDINSWETQEEDYRAEAHRKANKKMSDRDYESENHKLREALSEVREKAKEVNEFVESAKEGVLTFGYILRKISNNRAVIVTDDGTVECPIANGIDLSVGAMVKISNDVVVDNANINLPGKIYIVSAVDDAEVEIDMDGTPNRVFRNPYLKVEAGDRVVVDLSGQIIIRNLGKDQQKFSFNGNTGVSWNDIGGLETAKNALREAIELPAVHSELFKKYGKSVSKGVLLHGPTGCGKTMLAKAAATSLATTFSAKAKDTGFIYVKGPELLDKWVGNTESMIRGLFARARDHKKAHGYPAILFIDEADSLLGARGGANGEHSHVLSSTIVPQFLSEMDGLEDSGAFVLLATNRPDILDPAVVRDGRIDRKVYVGRPDVKGAADIIAIHLRNRPLNNGQNRTDLASYAAEKIYADEHLLYEVSFASTGGWTKEKEKTHMRLRDLVNGAMLAGIVENATSAALMRDIGKGNRKPTGIGTADIDSAILRALEENRDTNHEGAIEDFADTLGGKVTEIRKASNSKPPVSAVG